MPQSRIALRIVVAVVVAAFVIIVIDGGGDDDYGTVSQSLLMSMLKLMFLFLFLHALGVLVQMKEGLFTSRGIINGEYLVPDGPNKPTVFVRMAPGAAVPVDRHAPSTVDDEPHDATPSPHMHRTSSRYIPAGAGDAGFATPAAPGGYGYGPAPPQAYPPAVAAPAPVEPARPPVTLSSEWVRVNDGVGTASLVPMQAAGVWCRGFARSVTTSWCGFSIFARVRQAVLRKPGAGIDNSRPANHHRVSGEPSYPSGIVMCVSFVAAQFDHESACCIRDLRTDSVHRRPHWPEPATVRVTEALLLVFSVFML